MEDWLGVVYAVVGVLGGGGGIAALLKARADARKGVRDTDIAAVSADAGYWKSIIETQTKVLLDPLKEQVGALGAQVIVLEAKVDALEADNRTLQRRDHLWQMWVDDLLDHINDEKGPPAPGRPPGLS